LGLQHLILHLVLCIVRDKKEEWGDIEEAFFISFGLTSLALMLVDGEKWTDGYKVEAMKARLESCNLIWIIGLTSEFVLA